MGGVTSAAQRSAAPVFFQQAHGDALPPAEGREPFASAYRRAAPSDLKLHVPRLLRPIPSIAGLASQAAEAGFAAESELLYRHAFARGETGPQIDRSLRRQTARIFAKGFKLSVGSLSPHGVEREIPVRNSAELIRILRDELKSRLTLMDLCELMDVGRPRLPLQGLIVEYALDRDGFRSIGITGKYDLRRLENGWCRYECCFELDGEGRPELLARGIRVSELIKGGGIGARSLLALALFCARHGIPGWGERVQDDGIFAWRRMGGRLNADGLQHARGLLESLAESGAVSGLRLFDADWTDPESIAAVRVSPEQVRDRHAFERWLHQELRLCGSEIAMLPQPCPVGYQALRASPLYAGYDTGEILRRLVEEYFPRRIANGGGQAMIDALAAAERERSLLAFSESAAARHLASGLIEARAAVQLFTPAAALFPRLLGIRGR